MPSPADPRSTRPGARADHPPHRRALLHRGRARSAAVRRASARSPRGFGAPGEAAGGLSEVATLVHGDPDAIPAHGYFVGPCLFRAEGGVNAPFVHDHEVFGPVATVLPWDGEADGAIDLVARGRGCLVTAVYSDDVAWAGRVILGIAAHNGRVQWGSKKIHDQGAGPGTVLPNLVHGGPGRAGGGEELGAERGMRFYSQRTAIQGDRALLERAGLAVASGGT